MINFEEVWGLQTVLDTLAVGENIPVRAIHSNRLREFDKEIRKICQFSELQDKLDNGSSLLEFYDSLLGDGEIEDHIELWVDIVSDCGLDKDLSGVKKLFSEDWTLFLEIIFPFLERNIFLTLSSNAIPFDNLCKNTIRCWRWYNLFWIYHALISEKRLFLSHQSEDVNICDNAFDIGSLYFGYSKVLANKDLILLFGPTFNTNISPLSEINFEQITIDPTILFLRKFQLFLSRTNSSISKDRFLRAAMSEPPMPKNNLKLRASNIISALRLMNKWDMRAIKINKHNEIRIMALWALFIIQRKKRMEVNDKLSGFRKTLFSFKKSNAVEIGFKLDSISDESDKNIWLTATLSLTGNKNIQLSIRNDSYDIKNINKDFGFQLECFSENKNTTEIISLLDYMRLKFSNLLIRFDQRTRLLENKRILIFNDWLQERFGTLTSDTTDEKISSYDISRWVNELLRADRTCLYQYVSCDGIYGKLRRTGIFNHQPLENVLENNLENNIEDFAKDFISRKKCACYRAYDSEEQKVILSYDYETKKSFPKDQNICFSENYKGLEVKGAIATPLIINGRAFGVLEVQSFTKWMFRWGDRIPLQQISSAISPFLFQHRYINSLRTIQDLILKFHNDELQSIDLYSGICKSLVEVFLCDGSSLWIRNETGNTKIFKREGKFNIDREQEEVNLEDQDSFISTLVSDFEFDRKTYIFKSIDLTDDFEQIILQPDELLNQGINILTLVPIYSGVNNKITAILSLYSRSSNEYSDSWKGVIGFISNFLSLVVEAANIFIEARKFGESLHLHEMYHDASFISYKGQKISQNFNNIKRVSEVISKICTNPWFIDKSDTANLLNKLNTSELQELKSFPRTLDSVVFKTDEDLKFFSDTLKTRINILFGKGTAEYTKEQIDFLGLTGNMELSKSIDWINEKEEYIELNSIYNALKEGNDEIRSKGIFSDLDVEYRGIKLLMRKTVLVTVFRNLLMNAVKYSQNNKHVSLNFSKYDKNMYVLSIENIGNSFDDPNEVFYVLGPKSRGSNSIDDGGMGMGLYNIKLLTELMKFEFTFIEDRLDGGVSKFTAELLIPQERVKI